MSAHKLFKHANGKINMNVKYTNHAEYQLKERKIERVWVEETIKSPDKITRDGKKNYAIKKLNGYTLKVVYVKEERFIKVITEYWL